MVKDTTRAIVTYGRRGPCQTTVEMEKELRDSAIENGYVPFRDSQIELDGKVNGVTFCIIKLRCVFVGKTNAKSKAVRDMVLSDGNRRLVPTVYNPDFITAWRKNNEVKI